MPKVILESDSRENELVGLLGTNKTGKTTKLRSLIMKWKANNDGPVMAFDPQNKLSDLIDFRINPTNKNFPIEILNLRDALLILDDVRILHPKNIAEAWLMDLMQYRNGYNIDIFYATHNPSLVLNILSYFTTKYYVFYTESTLGSWEKKIPNYNLCMAASLYINRYVSIKGRGNYPNFPHVMVDNENQKLTGVNIEK